MSEQKKWKKVGIYAKYGDTVLGSSTVSKNSTVTGHFDEDKTYHDFLRAEHVELSKQYGLKYDESKVQEESENGDVENQQEENAVEEDEAAPEPEVVEPTPAPPTKAKKSSTSSVVATTEVAQSSDLASTLEKYFKSTSSSLLSLLSPIFEEQARRLAELEEEKTALEAKNTKLETSLKKAQNALKAFME